MGAARKKARRPKPSATRRLNIERQLKASAFPLAFGGGSEFRIGDQGLTKLQFCAALIAAGIRAGGAMCPSVDVARQALEDAEALLGEFTK